MEPVDAPWIDASHEDENSTEDQMTTLRICTNWKNSAADTKKTAFEIYETNGIFPTACRHGQIEILCEIVRSGEL